ncbi:MAG TPA: DinB family protein [Dongiaceae bacterium]|nr:DinB family protein [Dongiaceae bacterium]
MEVRPPFVFLAGRGFARHTGLVNAGDKALPLEPWLRETLSDLPVVARAVLHALQLAHEDIERHCADLRTEEIHTRPGGVASVAFHLRHIARSVDRLLTYAEGGALSEEQHAALADEMAPRGTAAEILDEAREALQRGDARVRALADLDLKAPRAVGRRAIPTTLGGLLVHLAEHTQRHAGQAITTAKMVRAGRTR